MSQENVELVRSIYAAWERGDFRSVDWADPEIEFVIADGPDPGSWRGIDGMAKAALGWVGSFDAYRAEVEHLREAHPGCVLALVRGYGRARGSTATAEDRGAGVFEIRSGKVTRLALYTDRDRALADLGLSEQAMSQENVEIVMSGSQATNAGRMDALREILDPTRSNE